MRKLTMFGVTMWMFSLAGSGVSHAGRVILANRVADAPVIDGKLTEECWRAAAPITGYKQIDSQVEAKYQSNGYVLYDDANLYVGVNCLEPNPANIRTKPRKHDENVFADDVVEIMIDPGASKTNYFQFAVNPSGATFDCSRADRGASEDDEWNGDMRAGAFIGDDYWSVEVAIPYCTLALTPRVGSTWGINLCREKLNPSELSSIGESGAFNKAGKFATLKGLDVNFHDYCLRIGSPRVSCEFKGGSLLATAAVPVKNETGTNRELNVQCLVSDVSGGVSSKSSVLTLAAGEEALLALEPLRLKASMPGATDVYSVLPGPSTRRIVLSDARTGKVLALSNAQYPKRFRVLDVKVLQPALAEKPVPPPRASEVTIEVTIGLSEAELRKGTLSLEVVRESDSRVVARRSLNRPGAVGRIALPVAGLPTGRLVVNAMFVGADGQAMAETRRSFVNLGHGEGGGRVLNNLVTELLNVTTASRSDKSLEFVNPRDGWVFFASAAAAGGGRTEVSLQRGASEDRLLVHEVGRERALEAMRWLRAGEYSLEVRGSGERALTSLVVRAIPELVYCKFPSNPQVTGHGLFDWDFLQKYLLPNVNCIVGTGDRSQQPYVEQWKKAGRKWIVECPLPGLAGDATITTDEAYKFWAANPGYADPSLDGIIVDEFCGGDLQKYDAWTEALRRLIANEPFKGKTFYPYCGILTGAEASRAFAETVAGAGFRFAWEQYLKEQPTEEDAREFLESTLRQGMIAWEKGLPGVVNHTIVCFGYLCAPPESVNTNAGVDYKVWMDMQYNLIANAPAFRGLYGVMEYTSSYADEEAVRWQGQLYRHYCIEGKRTLLSKEYGFRYVLTHVQNPDFNEGTREWTVAPAEEGTISVGHMDGLGWLEGRYPRTPEGDNFLLMKRSNTRPNTASQEIKNLKPGQLYSLKMFTADHRDLIEGKSVRQKHAVSVGIENVEMAPTNCFQEVIPSCYAHSLGPFNVSHRAWLNYHWKVFRAKGKTARLTVSDWVSANEPGGPSNQELAFNFVEVQPYVGK